jgi:hypothetical protein
MLPLTTFHLRLIKDEILSRKSFWKGFGNVEAQHILRHL